MDPKETHYFKLGFGLKYAYPFDIQMGLVITICHLRDTSIHLVWKLCCS